MPTSDTPISQPDQDDFGFDPLASALARSVAEMAAPDGVVIGINGIWGSGKSSLLNLVLYHLQPKIVHRAIYVVHFNPWWFSGPEALAAAFLGEMQRALSKGIGKKALNAFRAVARRVLPNEPLLKMASETIQPGSGEIAAAAGGLVAQLLDPKDGLDDQHAKVVGLLEKCKTRFLVVVDDIDRVTPDESLQLLRLIKSVGRLPNTIYLLALDRSLVEKLITHRYPSEGPHYLEKIVQAFFDVPAPSKYELSEAFHTATETICRTGHGDDELKFVSTTSCWTWSCRYFGPRATSSA
jgi:predicted KAP-like P-loop ATPase